MKFRRIKIENLGPYVGSHTLELDVDDAAPVVLVHGENMRGKTSLFNAIRWVLYGKAVGRRGRTLPAVSLLSYDARDALDYHILVELEFEHEGVEYQLERQAQAEVLPRTDRDLQHSARLRRGGHIQPAENVQQIISDILHPDISRFFLFDGEMLDQYEILLGEGNRDSDLVRQSIEQILGLPALQLLVEDVASIRRETEAQLLRSAEAARRNVAAVASARQALASIEALTDDIKRLQEQREGLLAERDTLADRLAGFGEIQADLREIERLESEIKDREAIRDDARAQCQTIIRENWWLPVSFLMRTRLDASRAASAEATERFEDAADLRARLSIARKGAERSICETCGQPLSDDLQSRFRDEVAQLEKDLKVLDVPAGALAEALAEQRSLEVFANTAAAERLTTTEATFRRANIDIRRFTNEAERVRERLKGHDRTEIAASEIQYEQCVRQIVSIEASIKGHQESLEIQKSALGRLQARIAQTPGTDPRVRLQSQAFAALEATIAAAVDVFRQEVRVEVERQASEIFRHLTTEPDYAGLSINDNYGLTILDGQGREIRERSAGAEQVVALALVGGLNRSATRQAPVVMDTPFGRLDVRHRENILHFVPTLAGQVLLLVQSGELDRERDLGHLAGFIGREYRIVRDGPTRSHFEVVA